MSNTLRVKAAEYGEQQLEALGMVARIEFELADGTFVELVHPWLWDDKVRAAANVVDMGADFDRDENGDLKQPFTIGGNTPEPYSVRIARAVLGTKELARFLKGGGKTGQIALAIEMMKQPSTVEDGPDPKGQRPKRS